MPESNKSNLLTRIIVAAVIIIALVVFIINILYQLTYGSFSGISYKYYLIASANAILVLIGAYVVYRLASYAVIHSIGHRMDPGTIDIVKLILRTIVLVIGIFLILTTFGFNSSSAIGVGAIGGVVIGLAAQTITTSVLSGVFVSSSRVIRPGDVLVMKSSAWGEITASVVNVSLLWTYVVNQYGNSMYIPNSALFGNTLFTKLKYPDELRYLLKISLNADVPSKRIKEKASHEITMEFVKRKVMPPNIYFSGSDGITNTFAIALRFNKFAELNELTDIVNTAFNNAYWEVKSRGKGG